MLPKTEKTGLESGYERRDFATGPSTYTDAGFSQKIYEATGLADRTTPAKVADIMSGPGKVGLALQERDPRHRFFFLDLAGGQLSKISPDENRFRLVGDARALPLADGYLDIVVVRYALKDLTIDEQPVALKEILRGLRPGGELIIADMVSPEVQGAKEWLNKQHALKQELSGRNPLTEGVCHIPTQSEWVVLLEQAGFHVEMYDSHLSCVTTTDWVKGKQVTVEQLVQLDQMIMEAPPMVKKAFNIRKEDALVKIDYPLVILRAVKPAYGKES